MPTLIQNDLNLIIEALQPVLNGRGSVGFYQEIADRLSRIVGKDPSWSWRYVQGVSKGTLAASVKFGRAVRALGAELDGVPVEVADTEQVQVWVRPGSVRPGSVVLGASRFCDNPACMVSFVPRVPWQRYHSAACRRSSGRAGE